MAATPVPDPQHLASTPEFTEFFPYTHDVNSFESATVECAVINTDYAMT
jgi:hypothetical protein